MIIGGILITLALVAYYFYYPNLPPKGSVAYYKYRWKQLTN